MPNRVMRRLTSIFVGFILVSLGTYVVGSSLSILTCLAGITCFTFGEMFCSPKDARVPGGDCATGQEGPGHGLCQIPDAFGWGYGSFLAGQIDEPTGEKAALSLRYMSEVLQVHTLPDRSAAFARLTEMLGQTGSGHPALVGQIRSRLGLDALCHRRHFGLHCHVCLHPPGPAVAGCQRLKARSGKHKRPPGRSAMEVFSLFSE